MKYLPKDDGITHINIYSRGKTELGRLLSNFAFTPFECSDGKFNSVEGYWYWLLGARDSIRNLSGFTAKKIGREDAEKNIPKYSKQEFETKIKKAFRAKLQANLELKELFIGSSLPFDHYYVVNGKRIDADKHYWQIEYWEILRENLK
jgi:hypothetical protein